MLQDAIRSVDVARGKMVVPYVVDIFSYMKKTSIHFNTLWQSSVTFGGKIGVGQCGKNKGKGKGVKRSRGTAWFWGCLDEDRRP